MPLHLVQDFWPWAERYIALDTSRSNAGVADFARDLLAPLKPRLHVQPGDNVLASWGPDGPGGLLLVTHSDTVLPGPLDRWTDGPPHQLTYKGERVVGLGTADVKLDYICKAFALRSLDLTQLKKPLHLLATYGEEVGLQGAKAFLSLGLKPDWVLCGEPSELIPCHAHKGYAMTRVTATVPSKVVVAKGKAAHSSTPHLGVNAISALLDALPDGPLTAFHGGSSPNTIPAEASAVVGQDLRPALVALRQAWSTWQQLVRELTPREDADFTPATAVANWNVATSTADAITATFDARLLPGHDPAALHADFAARLPANCTATVERDAPGMKAPLTDPLIAALVQASGKQPKAKPTSTEAGVFHRAGMSAAVFGPGVSTGNAHTANEWMRVGDLPQAIAIYETLVRTLCF